MDKTEIYAKLAGIFHEVFDDDFIVFRPELSADDVDDWDSLSHIRLILTVERAFDVKFSASAIGKLRNVGQLAELIHSKTS